MATSYLKPIGIQKQGKDQKEKFNFLVISPSGDHMTSIVGLNGYRLSPTSLFQISLWTSCFSSNHI